MNDDLETPENTAGKTRRGGFQKGFDPRRGHGLKGRSGRPPNEYRESLRKILDDPKVAAALKTILRDPKHPQFAALYARVVTQAHGNPPQPVGGGDDGTGPIEVKVTYEIVDPKDGH